MIREERNTQQAPSTGTAAMIDNGQPSVSNDSGMKDASAEAAPADSSNALRNPGAATLEASAAPGVDVAANVDDAEKKDASGNDGDSVTDLEALAAAPIATSGNDGGSTVDLEALAAAPTAKGPIFDALMPKSTHADKVTTNDDGSKAVTEATTTTTPAENTATNGKIDSVSTSGPPKSAIDVDADEEEDKEAGEEVEETLKAKVGRRGDTKRRMPSIASWGNRKDDDDDGDDDDDEGGRRRGVREIVSVFLLHLVLHIMGLFEACFVPYDFFLIRRVFLVLSTTLTTLF